MATVQQHLAFDRDDGASRSGARHCSRNMLPHRAAELFPVPSVGVVAPAGASGVGVPRHAGGACGHRHGHDPLVLVKLWSVYPNRFRWPPFRSVKQVVERLTVALLVSSTLVQLFTGFFNVLGWYPFRWDFLSVHYYLAYVVVGSVLLHIAVKLPDIVYGLQTKVADGDVLTEVPWNENPESHSIAGPLPPPVTRDCPGAVADCGRRWDRRRRRNVSGAGADPLLSRSGCSPPGSQARALGCGGRPDRRGGERDRRRHGIPLDAPDHRSYVVRTDVG